MCGIIAVLARPNDRTPPGASALVEGVDAAWRALGTRDASAAQAFATAADELAEVDRLLKGTPGVRTLLQEPSLSQTLAERMDAFQSEIAGLERDLDSGAVNLGDVSLEAVNAAMIRLKDAVWAIRHDRLRTAQAVAELAGAEAGPAAIAACWQIQVALSSLDRLEVRGRDSAGLHVLVDGHGLDLASHGVKAMLAERTSDPLFTAGAVRTPNGKLSFVYKAAAEIGELGDNVRELRLQMTNDVLLRRALGADTAVATVLGHTRWASVGIISQPNAHPLNQEEQGVAEMPYVTAALNGDVDNYAELREEEGLTIAPEITTDAKVIPTLVARRLAEGSDATEAFRSTVARFDGSVAIGTSPADEPDRLYLALRGSGQALYVGLAEDAFIVASELYGLVEETNTYLRMDGEAAIDGVPGQVIVLDRAGAGTVAGITRLSYTGDDLPVTDDDIQQEVIATRDIDRGGFPHFLLKELSESPRSFLKTLRGRIVEEGGLLTVHLGDETLPPLLRGRIRDGSLKRITVVGQGTAAVAGQSVAGAIGDALVGSGITVTALPATELSGFHLDDDMSDMLVVAISQSGTTTDTNRTTDLARARGAIVVAIVNRRGSDLVDKSDGVLYNSDGRDVEMAVPSTKAFYAQVAAGFLLAAGLAQEAGTLDRHRTSELLAGLRALPAAMQRVLDQRDAIAAVAQHHAPSRRYWAIVGNGPNRVAAQELRIKLSELCYKSISWDVTEDKKHIDLSSEPLILVCAAGLTGPNADDVGKEVAIYRAHKAAPIVVATEGTAFPAALDTIVVPEVHPALAFVLSAMAGHLFGYEAALAIDAQARPLREARAAIEARAGRTPEHEVLEALSHDLWPPASRFFDGLRSRAYDGHLEASTAVRLAGMFRYALGLAPIEGFEVETGKTASPANVVDDLTDALTRGIEELTRPIDAIKHQAKTVTVGISRSEDALVESSLVQALLAAGVARDRLSYRSLRTLSELGPAVATTTGYTRYAVEGSIADDDATITVIDKGGVAAGLASRTEVDPRLVGTKRRSADEREVTVARGRRDGRTIIIVPEVKQGEVTGITVLHCDFHDRLPADAMKRVLQAYRTRYTALVDAVAETEGSFREDVLGEVAPIDLLVEPVHVLADRWR